MNESRTIQFGMSISGRLVFTALLIAGLFAALVITVYVAFSSLSDAVDRQTEGVSAAAQAIVRLTNGQWRLRSSMQSLQAVESAESIAAQLEDVTANVSSNQALVTSLMKSPLSQEAHIRVASADRFLVTETTIDALAEVGLDSATIAMLSALVNDEAIERATFNRYLDAFQENLTHEQRTEILDLAGVPVRMTEALQYIGEHNDEIQRLAAASADKLRSVLELSVRRVKVVDDILNATAVFVGGMYVEDSSLSDLQQVVNAMATADRADSVRSLHSSYENAAVRVSDKLYDDDSKNQLEALSMRIDKAVALLVQTEQARDELRVLDRQSEDTHAQVAEVLSRLDSALATETEKGALSLVSGLGNFVRTVFVLGLVGIGLSLLLNLLLRRSILGPLAAVMAAASRLRSRDLGADSGLHRVAQRRDELGLLSSTLLSVIDELRTVIASLSDGVSSLSAASADIVSSAQTASSGASQQLATVSQVSTTTEQLRQTGSTAAASATEVVESSEQAASRGQDGLAAVEQANATMDVIFDRVGEIAAKILQLNEQTNQVNDIVTKVNDIAEQSNLLAVNASIEAAKAGELGRGFAVVATEVRNLAEQSKRSTEQISQILAEIQRSSQGAVMAAEEGTKRVEDGRNAIETVHGIVSELGHVLETNSDKARQISGSVTQQASGVQEIAGAMQSVAQASSDGERGAKTLAAAADKLTELAQSLEAMTARFSM